MNLTVELILGIIGAVGTIWTITTYFLPSFQEYKKNDILEKKLGRGPYDDATIQQATKYYIQPKCSEVDPSIEFEPLYFSRERKDLFGTIDFFLQKDTKHRHLFVLADSGMGKTAFVLNYYAHNTRLPTRKRQKISIVPLGIPNADELIRRAASSTDFVIFLDGFDEDVNAINNIKNRLDALMQMCQGFKKIIITCRTQFFNKASDIPWSTGLSRIGPSPAGDSKQYEFIRYFLSPFSDDEVKQYIKRRFSSWNRSQRSKALNFVHKIPLLSVRPMLLTHIPDLLATGREFNYSHQIYDAMVNAWIERESPIVDKDDLRKFSNRLAVDLYLNRDTRGAERIPYTELTKLTRQWGIPIEQWKLSSRSLLNRDSEGNYKFAHRSIMEYLFVQQLIEKNENCYGVYLTDQMIMFLKEMLPVKFDNPINYQIAVINSSTLLKMLLNKDFDPLNVKNRLEVFVLSVAKGLAWSKIGSALFLQVDREIQEHNPSINFFSLSDWKNLEEKLVSLANYDQTGDNKKTTSRKLGSFLIKMQQTFPQFRNFEEVPNLNSLIAKTLVVKFFELGINVDEAESKIENILSDSTIYFWGESDYWNLWYRVVLLSLLSRYGMDVLKEVLTIKESAVLAPLVNGHNESRDFALIIK